MILLANLPGCRSTVRKPVEPLRISLPALEQNALIYIAADQGYFQQNGLDVTTQDYDSGVAALQALQDNDADLAVAAEFPVVRLLFQDTSLAVIASLDKFENDFIIARKDRGITQIADLKGKQVGVALKTINEFYLARFLELNGLQQADVTLVDLKPTEFVEAFSNGRVDALIAWQPYISQLKQKMADVVIWPGQSSQPVYGLLVARQPWLAENPTAIRGFLQSLLQAEDFIANHPQAAKTIIQNRLKYEADYVDEIWQDHNFGLALDPSLIVAMSDEARWLIRSGFSDRTEAPEFYDAIYLDGLEALKPEAVTIRR
jgi:NitT/TauT family transport system substrate-binding protein